MNKGRGRGWNTDSKCLQNKNPTQENTVPKKYAEACAKIQQSLERYMCEGEEQSSDEEDNALEDETILSKVLHSYNEGGDSSFPADKSECSVKETLTSVGNVCLICIETVKRNDAIWSCKSCFCILHLTCIQKWAKDSIDFQTIALENNSILQQRIKWCCPKCRKEHESGDRPHEYRCFCGKVSNPTPDPWVLPHSCGESCGRPLGAPCTHFCLLLCHPGRCPPCPKIIETSCYCGKGGKNMRRCGNREWTCGHKCSRELACKLHVCEEICHKGSCKPCLKESLQKCICGREEALRECASPTWQCKQICNTPLSCGHHLCERQCHTDPCGDCPRANSRSCPCGKTKDIIPCTEDVAPCGDTCDKLLDCGLHRCSHRCHLGPCGNCLELKVKQCRCGAKSKSVPCFKEYICDTKCKRLRDCRNHTCSRKCCEGPCPPCEQTCGRTLKCKNHKCNSLCHQGHCYPCPLSANIKCYCGQTKISVPCGREKTTKPPKCNLPCKIPPDCHHSKRLPHNCHFGRCPPCKQTCSQGLEGCDHLCPSLCHDAVLTKVVSSHARAGPWEAAPAAREEIVRQNCLPCLVPVPRTCLGLHETSDFPCSMARPWSCERPCGRLLSCTNHTCQLPCHAVLNPISETQAGENCGTCEERCSLSRPEGCTHICGRDCHPTPCALCTQRVRTSCHCGLSTLYVPCDQWCSASMEQKKELLCCQNRCPKLLSCGHRCPQVCHGDVCPGREVCKKKVTLRCLCKRLKQEVICLRWDGVGLPCDDLCRELESKGKKEAERKQDEAEAERQKRELDEYRRKFEGKRRKVKRQKELAEDSQGWQLDWKTMMAATAAFVLVASVAMYLVLSE